MSIPVIHTLDPAYTVIEKLGGKGEVCEALGLDKSTLDRLRSEVARLDQERAGDKSPSEDNP